MASQFRFLHAADVHLDSPLQSLERYEGAPVEELRLATRRALENVVRTAIDERVAFVLISGDLYDGDWRDYNTGLFFVSQLAALKQAGIPVYMVYGNHDAANRMTHSLPWPDNVKFFSYRQPETFCDEAHGVALHGQSFKDQHVAEDIAARYPAARSGYFNIGLLHTSADGRKGHGVYAPCNLGSLGAKGYDYWALGHVHACEVVAETPHIVYPGNIQGRSVRETGPKGCYIAEVGDGHRVDLRFTPTDVARWAVCMLRLEEEPGPELEEAFHRQLRNLVTDCDGRVLAVRVILEARGAAARRIAAQLEEWKQRFRAVGIQAGSGAVWIEKTVLVQRPETEPARPAAPGPFGEIEAVLRELRADPACLRELAGELSDLREKIAGELQAETGCPDPEDSEVLKSILDEVEPLLADRLLAPGGGQ